MPISEFHGTLAGPKLYLPYLYILNSSFGNENYLRKQIHIGVPKKLAPAKSGITIGKASELTRYRCGDRSHVV